MYMYYNYGDRIHHWLFPLTSVQVSFCIPVVYMYLHHVCLIQSSVLFTRIINVFVAAYTLTKILHACCTHACNCAAHILHTYHTHCACMQHRCCKSKIGLTLDDCQTVAQLHVR